MIRLYKNQDFDIVTHFWRGARTEKFGASPPPENEPDVEYHWRP